MIVFFADSCRFGKNELDVRYHHRWIHLSLHYTSQFADLLELRQEAFNQMRHRRFGAVVLNWQQLNDDVLHSGGIICPLFCRLPLNDIPQMSINMLTAGYMFTLNSIRNVA